MSDDGSIDDDFYDQINDIYDWRNPLTRLSTRLRSSNNFLRNDSEVYSNTIRQHRDKTLDSVLKLHREASKARSWSWFKRTADHLAVMHRMVTEQVDDVSRSGFENGTLAFSRNFLRDFRRKLQRMDRVGSNLVVPNSVLESLLVSTHDPPLGTFKQARPTLRARRYRRASQKQSLPHGFRRLVSSAAQSSSEQHRPISGLEDFCCCCSAESSSSSSSISCSSPSSSSDLERS